MLKTTIRFCFSLFILLSLPGLALAKEVCAQDTLCVEVKQKGKALQFFAINKKKLLPISGKIDLKLKNMKFARGENIPFVLKGSERRWLFTLRQRNTNKAWRYNYEFSWVRGDVTAKHDDNHAYALPYKNGTRFEVSQGCNGKFSHFGDQRFAIDFSMPIGTAIHAARAGRVVDVKEDSNKGGPLPRFREEANYVMIQHSDRTLGMYFHLRKNGVEVKMGDQIKAGDLLGYSGNTGFSSGPHLHFEVSRGAKDFSEDVSVPITFQTRSGKKTCLNKGTRPISR